MDQYRKQVLEASASTLLGAIIAGALAVTVPNPGSTLVPLSGSALVLVGAYFFLGERRALAIVWPAPLVAAAVVFLSRDPASIRAAAISLAILSVLGALTWRVPAYFARKGRELGERD
ncbi:MAG: hypothetical protein ABEJ77_05550 [Halanaeroarchaeum sp.]